MIGRHIAGVAGAILVCACATVPGAPAARSGNPILPGWYADPEAHVFEGRYWIYPTYSAPYDQQTFLDAFSSRDLVTWTKHPQVLDTANVAWARRAVWAPSVVQKDGWYYLFFGANDIQSDREVGGIGVARSRTPDGPFTDYLGQPLVGAFHNGAQPIDQFVFRDEDGSYYLIYGGWRHCNIARLNDTFTGFVFKIQANMDPKHRDRIAFVRITSGRFEPGMQVTNARSSERIRLAQPQQFMAQERRHVADAWPGDVIGVHDRGSLRIGDSLSSDVPLRIERMPRFSPEHFARISVPDPLRRKHLDKGLRQLSEEGAAQVFYATTHAGPEPLVGAVGRLQFDVLLHRLKHEYGVEARLENMPYGFARWVTGPQAEIDRLATSTGRSLVFDSKNRPLLLFDSEWTMRHTIERHDTLQFHDVAP